MGTLDAPLYHRCKGPKGENVPLGTLSSLRFRPPKSLSRKDVPPRSTVGVQGRRSLGVGGSRAMHLYRSLDDANPFRCPDAQLQHQQSLWRRYGCDDVGFFEMVEGFFDRAAGIMEDQL